MPFDGVALRAIVNELNERLIPGRIDKIQQPEKDEIILTIRSRFESVRLLISISPSLARCHITNQGKAVPKNAPMFSMLLRKRLTSGRFLSIKSYGMDRILEMEISSLDELGLESHYTLICEFMGRHSNIILCDKNGVIVDAIKRIDEEKSRVREVLPGIRYEYPPSRQQLNAAESSAETLAVRLKEETGSYSTRLCAAAEGFSKPTAKEFVYYAGLPEHEAPTEKGLNTLAEAVHTRLNDPDLLSPAVVLDDQQHPIDFLAYKSNFYSSVQPYAFLSDAIEDAYAQKDKAARMEQKGSAMIQALTTVLNREQRKAEKQQEELRSAENCDELRLYAELLTANIYQLTRSESAHVQNYYDENGGYLDIPMDIRLTPKENAQAYYKKYNKAKATLAKLKQHYEQCLEEIEYLTLQIYTIENCPGEAELEEIRDELLSQGYLKQTRANVKKALAPSVPMKFMSRDGFEFYVGRNNTQNDALTLRFARAEDIWLHAKNTPGSHVIIKANGRQVPPSTIYDAALAAAWFSRARGSSSIAVDYTQKRNVKKPNGARPGYVIYTTNQTEYVTPEEQDIRRMEIKTDKK